jgi:hypothetical protein
MTEPDTDPGHARAVVEALCALEPADVWTAFRAVAADPREPEDRRVRAAAWLAIANAVGSLRQGDGEVSGEGEQ